jgi:two-component system CheB/CheR fusion protein
MFIVGVGASAGGLEAITDLLNNFPENLDVALVIAQHLSPNYKSQLVSLLSKDSKLLVIEAEDGMSIQIGRAYITPPDRDIIVQDGKLVLLKPKTIMGPKPSIDTLFSSISKEYKNKAIGVVLSGTGTDGSHGIREIKESGGLTIVQEPSSAKYNGMPLSAIETGLVDLVITSDKIGEEIREWMESPESKRDFFKEFSDDQKNLDILFQLLSQKTGTDFSDYKPATILRRLVKRLESLKIPNLKDYVEYIKSKPEELDIIFKMILIGVTEFFRDPEAFIELEKYLQQIIAKKKPGDSIRIWSPGASSGEEAYSIAILIAKNLKEKLYNHNVQIFATDIDDKAIQIARRGVYQYSALEKLPPDIVEDFFIKHGDEYEIIKSIRPLVLFSKHDITSNPPFLKLDLICCRNLLIYFSANLQKQIFPLFHYSLNEDGYLFLGKSETIGQFSDLFSTISNKYKIFQKRHSSVNNVVRFGNFKNRKSVIQTATSNVTKKATNEEIVKEALFRNNDQPFVLINDSFNMLEIFGDVSNFLGLSQGVMNSNIIKLAKPELQLQLRSVLNRCFKEKRLVKTDLKRFSASGPSSALYRIVAMPSTENLYLVSFELFENAESVAINRLDELSTDQRLKELEQELTSTREHLQSFIEELETSNEELQSLNEELMSTNEELQSSNEELETSNEELQSTNEELNIAYSELKSVNAILERQSSQLAISEANANALLNNTPQIYFLIDKNYRIILLNHNARELCRHFFLRLVKPGDSILDFIASSEIETFHSNFQKALSGKIINDELELWDSTAKKKHWFLLNFTPISVNSQISMISYSLLDVTEKKESESRINRNEILFNFIFDKLEEGVAVINSSFEIEKVNEKFCRMTGFAKEELHFREVTSLFQSVDPEKLLNNSATERHDVLFTKLRRKDRSLLDVTRKVRSLQIGEEVEYILTVSTIEKNESKLSELLVKCITNELKMNRYKEKIAYLANDSFRKNTELFHAKISSLRGFEKNQEIGDLEKICNSLELSIENFLDGVKQEINSISLNLSSENLLELTLVILNTIREDIGNQKSRIIDYINISAGKNVLIDKILYFQILYHLLSNSIKFSSPESKIHIEIFYDNDLKISIKDFGIGIPENEIDQVFEFRFRAHNAKSISGFGFGLSMVKKAVDLMKGKIEITSKYGIETKVDISLPV